jgi:putative ABC transport system permease protein
MVIATLAIAIGTTTSLYVFLRAVLASQTPQIEELDAVGRIYASSRILGVERSPILLRDFQSPLAQASSFESIAAYQFGEHRIAIGAMTRTVSVGQVSETFFDVFRLRAASGRLMTIDDARRRVPVMVVSDSLWRQFFKDRPSAEATLVMDGTMWNVVGVLPASFALPFLGINADAWTLMPTSADTASRSVSVVARIRKDRSWAAASAELDGLARAHSSSRQWTWTAIPVGVDLDKRRAGASAFILGPAVIVLLIGCVNVACMVLGRGIDREVELSVRAALGASRGRIVRQLIGEHMLLAGLAGALGSGLAFGILRVITSSLAAFPAAPALTPDASILVVACAVSVLSLVLFGTWPAIRLSRSDGAICLSGGHTLTSIGVAGYRSRDLIVFVELALAVVLIVVAGMWLNMFAELRRITPTFAADQVVAAQIDGKDLVATMDAISALPGVSRVAAASSLRGDRSSTVQLRAVNGRLARAARVAAQPSFFMTMGLPIVRGRTFEAAEANGKSRTVIVSETLAADLWPNENPIGAVVTIASRGGEASGVVIGVSADAWRLGSLAELRILSPEIYVPMDRDPANEVVVVARANGPARGLIRPIEGLLSGRGAVTPRAALVEEFTPFVRDESMLLVEILGAFGLVALVLAATGVFGVLTQSVSQRTGEFGVRMALGASAGAVWRMVVTREAKLIVTAIATGSTATVLVTQSVFAELARMSATDGRLWLVIATLCGGTAAAAVALATHRIVRLDPWTVLRNP